MRKYNYLILLPSILYLPYISIYAETQSTMNIRGAIIGSCSLSIPLSVELPDVTPRILNATPVGTRLADDYSAEFELTADCASTAYNIYFIAPESNYISTCFDGTSTHRYLMFCLSRDNGVDLPFKVNSNNLEHESNNYGNTFASFMKPISENKTTIKVNLGRGDNSNVQMGEYSSPLVIIIQPI